jgi:hypothetical protein
MNLAQSVGVMTRGVLGSGHPCVDRIPTTLRHNNLRVGYGLVQTLHSHADADRDRSTRTTRSDPYATIDAPPS